MSFINKFKDFMGVGDDDFDDDFDETEEDTDFKNDFDSFSTAFDDAKPDWKEKPSSAREKRESSKESGKDNKVVNIHATTQLQVVLVKPEHFEDASSIADHLLAKRTVVLNLESTNREISRRLVDFLSGVAYANGGQIKKVANSTYIITPYNVGLMGDSLLDEIENSGLYL